MTNPPSPVNSVAETCLRLRALVIMDEVGSDNPLGRDAADLIAHLATEIERRDKLVEGAYREGHCDGRDLARTGRLGSEDWDWLESEAHAVLSTPSGGRND